MKVSVVIPCHNGEQTIKRALQSVSNQTVKPHEVIVVNDSSSDNSLACISSSPGVTAILNVTCGNAAVARDAGVDVATGDWVAFLDADDEWYPSHIEVARNVLLDSKCIAYMARADYVTSEGERTTNVNKWPLSTISTGLSGEEFLELYLENTYFCNVTLVFDRNRYLEIDGHDHEFRILHDVELFLRLVHGHTWAYNPTPQAKVFIHRAGSITASTIENSYWMFRAFHKNLTLFPTKTMLKLLRKTARVSLGIAFRNSASDLMRRQYLESLRYLYWTDRLKYKMGVVALYLIKGGKLVFRAKGP